MRAVVLVGGNFIREQRWYLVLLLTWAFGMAGVIGASKHLAPDDLGVYLHQQALYGVAVSAFMAAAAIHTERRSRCILAVLSKAVERREYLAGLLCGVVVVSAIFFLATGIGAHWMAARLHLSAVNAWSFIALLIVASVLLASYAMFFSTFLHPLLATVATAFAMATQLVLETAVAPASGIPTTLPISGLSQALLAFPFHPGWHPPAAAALLALAEAALLWLLAGKIFEGRDIAVAVD